MLQSLVNKAYSYVVLVQCLNTDIIVSLVQLRAQQTIVFVRNKIKTTSKCTSTIKMVKSSSSVSSLLSLEDKTSATCTGTTCQKLLFFFILHHAVNIFIPTLKLYILIWQSVDTELLLMPALSCNSKN